MFYLYLPVHTPPTIVKPSAHTSQLMVTLLIEVQSAHPTPQATKYKKRISSFRVLHYVISLLH